MYFPSDTHSMEGSVAKLHEIVELKKKYKVSIYVHVHVCGMVLNNIIPSWTLEFEVRGIAHSCVKLVHNVTQGLCVTLKLIV